MSSLLNQAAMKKFIFSKLAALRPGMEKKLTRVSKSALDSYEARLKNMIEDDVMTHPTIGKTFRLD